jgi:3-hydroxyacyl-CoA dehydrogenase
MSIKLGCNWPMCKTKIIDPDSVDVCANSIDDMYQMTGEERYRPFLLFEKMLAEKKLSRKAG